MPVATSGPQIDMSFDESGDPIVAQESSPASEYVDREDICHVCVVDIYSLDEENGIVPGVKFKLQVLAASEGNEDLIDRVHFEAFYFPNQSHKDKGKFAMQRLRALLMATGKVDPLISGGVYTIEYSYDQFFDHQFICRFKEQKRYNKKSEKNEEESEKKYFHIDGLKMWHIDDPEVATVNKCDELMGLAQGQRWDEAQKKAVVAKREEARAAAESAKGAKKAGKAGQPLPKGKAAESQLSDDDLDSL